MCDIFLSDTKTIVNFIKAQIIIDFKFQIFNKNLSILFENLEM